MNKIINFVAATFRLRTQAKACGYHVSAPCVLRISSRIPHLVSCISVLLRLLRWSLTSPLYALGFLLFSLRVLALTPIQYNAADFTGATNNLPVTLTSLMKVQVNNRTMLVGLPINFTPTNGSYTTNVYAGLYNLTIQAIPSGVTCLIPDSTNLQNLASCVISNLGLFSATNLNAVITNVVPVAAGTNIQLITNGPLITINGVVTNLNATNLTGSISQLVLSNSGVVTYPALNTNQFGTSSGKLFLIGGVAITNPAFSGLMTNVAISNATLTQTATLPTNIYLASGTLSGTNGKPFVKGTPGAFSALHIGDNIVVHGTAQFLVTSVTNANDTIGIYPVYGATESGIPFIVYPNAITFRDIDGNPWGGIGNDGSYVIQSWPGGNSGKLVLASGDGVSTAIIQLTSSDALGPALVFGTTLNVNTQGGIKLYNNVESDTLDACPDALYGGAVSVRAMTNLQGTAIPFRVAIQAGTVTAMTITVSNAPTLQATNSAPGDVTISSGVISTAPTLWLTITNNGVAYSVPAFK